MKRRLVPKQPYTENSVRNLISNLADGDLVLITDPDGVEHELEAIVHNITGISWCFTTTDSRVTEYNANNSDGSLTYCDYIRHLRNGRGAALLGDGELIEAMSTGVFSVR